MKAEIIMIGIEEYNKLSNIWDMRKCPFTEDFKKQIIQGLRLVYVYKQNGAFIGEVDLVLDMREKGYTIRGERIYLSRLIVKKECRNRKIGTRLIEFALNEAEKLGYSQVSLGVDCNNIIAYEMYRKNGFAVFETARDEYGEYYKMLKNLRE